MEAITALLLIYVLIYCGFIFRLIGGFANVKPFVAGDSKPETTFSIIVPFRNEDPNLPRLLESLAQLNYPTELFELIFVDDFSDDFSVNVINKWRLANGKIQTTILENLRLTASPKKNSIARAVPIIENQWIITTDADCKVPQNWLLTLNDYILNHDVSMLAGAVTYDGNWSLLHHFQRMDLMSLQGATIGSFGIGNGFMCNGANFAYTKKFFLELHGFQGNSKIASGDDVFLVQKAVAKHPEKVGYLKAKEAIVTTKPVESWDQLFHQRVRWAAKTGAYQSAYGEDLALVVFLGNLVVVVAAVLALFGVLDWRFPLVLWAVKCLPDWILLAQTNRFLWNGKFFFPVFSAVLYPFFCVAVALYSVFGNYQWKGRTYKQ